MALRDVGSMLRAMQEAEEEDGGFLGDVMGGLGIAKPALKLGGLALGMLFPPAAAISEAGTVAGQAGLAGATAGAGAAQALPEAVGMIPQGPGAGEVMANVLGGASKATGDVSGFIGGINELVGSKRLDEIDRLRRRNLIGLF